jgi:hypothetical protein
MLARAVARNPNAVLSERSEPEAPRLNWQRDNQGERDCTKTFGSYEITRLVTV